MDDLEFSIDDELFRVTERRQSSGMMSYDFAWLNGPDGGTYGFTVGLSSAPGLDPAARMTREQLMDQARGFIEGFYEPGGIGKEDFPNHTPARTPGRTIDRRSATAAPRGENPACHTEGVPIDIRAVLHRVVDEVFDESAFIKEEDDQGAPHVYRMRLSSHTALDGQERHAALVASYEWFQVHILDLDVGTIRFDYDDDEVAKRAELRDLAHLVRAYLQGGGEVTYRPSLILRRPMPTLTVEANGIRWRLRRSTSSETELQDSP